MYQIALIHDVQYLFLFLSGKNKIYYIEMMSFLVLIIVSLACLLLGLFLLLNPASAIEIQEKFYEKLNWRMEPVSMEKEVRNTKFMGVFLIIITFLAVVMGLWK